MHNFQLHLTLIAFCLVAGAATVTGAEPEVAARVAPFLQDHCLSCHTGEKPSGGLDLKKLGANLDNPDLLRRWVQIHDRVAAGEMPPKDEPRPAAKEAQGFLANLSTALTMADKQRLRVVLRRLNRVEYENTIRDLFGIRVDVK